MYEVHKIVPGTLRYYMIVITQLRDEQRRGKSGQLPYQIGKKKNGILQRKAEDSLVKFCLNSGSLITSTC